MKQRGKQLLMTDEQITLLAVLLTSSIKPQGCTVTESWYGRMTERLVDCEELLRHRLGLGGY